MGGRVVAVLGMHRSGTSWLAGELEARGLALGEVNTAAKYNARGNRENAEVMRIHDDVLAASGGRWNRPPRRTEWPDAQRGALAAFIARMDERFPSGWGFKDPRTLLVFDEWEHTIGSRLDLVGIYRHPESVARSLLAREMDAKDRVRSRRHALALWTTYCDRLVARHRRDAFPLMRFDAAESERAAQLDMVSTALGLHDGSASEAHFDGELVHEQVDGAVPRRCRATWAYLQQHALVAAR
jgi:hypothetical protein